MVRSGDAIRKLFVSYFLIIVVCLGMMGVLSYKTIIGNIENQSVESNLELLNQFKETVNYPRLKTEA